MRAADLTPGLGIERVHHTTGERSDYVVISVLDDMPSSVKITAELELTGRIDTWREMDDTEIEINYGMGGSL